MTLHTAIVVIALPLLWALAYWQGRLQERRRRTPRSLFLRPSFWLRPDASPGTKAGVTSTSDLTRRIAASTSSSTQPGPVSAAWAIPRTLRDESRITGRGWSTTGTATRGANGAPRAAAAWREHIDRVVDTVIQPAVADLPPDADPETRAKMFGERLRIHRAAGDFTPSRADADVLAPACGVCGSQLHPTTRCPW